MTEDIRLRVLADRAWATRVREEDRMFLLAAGVRQEDMTCTACWAVRDCEWAFDSYNTDGDCIADK